MDDASNTGNSTASSQALDTTALSDIATNSELMAQVLGQLNQALSSLADVVIPVPSGGTGRNSLTAHSVLLGEGTDPVNFAVPTANSGAALVGQGTGSDPIFGKVVLTQPATLATLTIANNKTLTASVTSTLTGGDGWSLSIAASKTVTISNSITFAGTDSTTMTFPSTSGNVTINATASQYQANTAGAFALTPNVVWTAAASVGLNMTNPSIPVDMSTGFNFGGTMTQNSTLANPTSAKQGQAGCFRMAASGATRTLNKDTNYFSSDSVVWPLSIPNGSVVYVYYWVQSSSVIIITGVIGPSFN